LTYTSTPKHLNTEYLRRKLKETAEKLEIHENLYKQNNLAVMEQIVSPVLQCLGWNVENPNEVQPFTIRDSCFPGYLLLKNRVNVLLIKVENLSTNINQKDNLKQAARCCIKKQVNHAVITNGANWLLIELNRRRKASWKTVWTVDIRDYRRPTTTNLLKFISKREIDNIKNFINILQWEKNRILKETWRLMLKSEDGAQYIAKLLAPTFAGKVKELYPDIEFELEEIESFLRKNIMIIQGIEGKTKRQQVNIPKHEKPKIRMTLNNKIYEIEHSYEILIHVAEWLIRQGVLTRKDCPIRFGRKKYLINVEPHHMYGDSFKHPKKLSNGLYIETHYSTVEHIRNAKRLLKKYGYREDILKIKHPYINNI